VAIKRNSSFNIYEIFERKAPKKNTQIDVELSQVVTPIEYVDGCFSSVKLFVGVASFECSSSWNCIKSQQAVFFT